MIWESIAWMTVIDLLIAAVALVSLLILRAQRRQLAEAEGLPGVSIAVLGLVIIGLFYVADLATMWILPWFIERERAMDLMRNLHLHYSWIAMLVAVLCIFFGLALTFRKLLLQASELSAANARLSNLFRQVVHVQEAERLHLARELHDEIGQSLTAVKLSLRETRDGEADPARLEEHYQYIGDTIERIRNFSLDLRPSILDDLGLVPALRWLVDRQAAQAGFTGRVVAEDEEWRLTRELELTCFRVAQEALANACHYADARHVQVELQRVDGEVQLTVEDDGRGFEVPAALERAKAGKSLGLLGMQERMRLAGGRLTIRSQAGEGTRIRASVPIQA